MEPTRLTFQQLQDITDCFSEERKLGGGGYGIVYKGEDKDGQEIAVKLLYNSRPESDEEDFKNEFDKLKKLNHPHTVKLIGYCYETQHEHMEHTGLTIFAGRTYRALCLEYMHNESLQDHLSEGICDGGLDWHTRFKIIKGACEGLKYLHEEFKEPIYHLDLKPENILLDINMVPKLADFGLAKIFRGEQTQITDSRTGTLGYMPPEYLDNGVISKKFDIFSMGVVMIKTISGLSGRSRTAEMSNQEFVDLVCNSWRLKLQEKWSGSSLEIYCQQVKKCIEIAFSCVEPDRKKRPNIVDMVRELSELEKEADEVSRCPGGDLLSVYPFQLVFPSAEGWKWELHQPRITCPLHLRNNTDQDITYRLLPPPYVSLSSQLTGLVPSRTTHTCFLTLLRPLFPTDKKYAFFTLESWVDESQVSQVKLVALYELPAGGGNKGASKVLLNMDRVASIDVHPTKPWSLMNSGPIVSIFNSEIQVMREVEITGGSLPWCLNDICDDYDLKADIMSVKFIEPKKMDCGGR